MSRIKEFFDTQTTLGMGGVGAYFATITFDLVLSRAIGILTITLLVTKLYALWFGKDKNKTDND